MDTLQSDISFAQIDWQDRNLPRSALCGDVYFSSAGGEAETLHNFIYGNNLPRRLAALQCNDKFVIAETGFGTGSNLLITAHVLRKEILYKNLQLYFYSFEKYPLKPEDMKFAHENYANYPLITPEFLEKYSACDFSSSVIGFNLLEDHLKVRIFLGDIKDTLRIFQKDVATPVDAWFLDGFAPSCNPDLWSMELFTAMSENGRKGHTTFATFTVAGTVRRNALSAGFKIKKTPGYGCKREMLQGCL